MADNEQDLNFLKQQIADLTARVFRLEQAAGVARVAPPAAKPAPAASAAPAQPTPAAAMQPAPVAARAKPEVSLESRIGGHWLNRIGIVAVLIGVSYFLKLAFDNNWIGEKGRVAIGLLVGIGVVFWSERFRAKNYQAFSYGLKAVGIGILYLSIWGASQNYQLIPVEAAFVAMIVVTASTAALALSQDAEILAAYAIVGGFATPLLLSTGQNREFVLFSYVGILDIGALVVTTLRPWRRLLLGSFAGTLLMYMGWYDKFYDDTQLNLTLSFASVFFAIFAVAPLLSRDVSSKTAAPNQVSRTLLILTLLTPAVYFLQAYAMLESYHRASLAWLAVALAAIYIFLSRQLRDATVAGSAQGGILPLMHVAVAVIFLTVAIPLKLESHWITLGWLVESAVLIWISVRTDSALVRVLGTTALSLAVFRLLVFDDYQTEHVIFNARFATYAVAVAILVAIAIYSRKPGGLGTPAAIAGIAANVLALIGLSREVYDVYERRIADIMAHNVSGDLRDQVLVRDFSFSALWMLYGAGLMIAGFKRNSAFLRWQAMILMAVTTLKVFVYDVHELDRVYRIVSFIVLGILLLGVSFAYQRDWLKLSQKKETEAGSEAQ